MITKDKNGFAIFLDGQFKDPKTCPESDKGKCPKCKTKLKPGYGFAGDYGLGSYLLCQKCWIAYDFVEEPDEE